jgi:hypothetical protein
VGTTRREAARGKFSRRWRVALTREQKREMSAASGVVVVLLVVVVVALAAGVAGRGPIALTATARQASLTPKRRSPPVGGLMRANKNSKPRLTGGVTPRLMHLPPILPLMVTIHGPLLLLPRAVLLQL